MAALTAACGDGGPRPTTLATSAPPGERAVVERVNDGDTITTTAGRRIRLVQIDAPELFRDCYGKAARAALEQLAPAGMRITLVRDPALDATDRYGRLLRYVLAGRTNVNVALVRQGAASPYFFRGDRGRYALELLAAVAEARAAPRGYWRACPEARLDPRAGSLTGRR